MIGLCGIARSQLWPFFHKSETRWHLWQERGGKKNSGGGINFCACRALCTPDIAGAHTKQTPYLAQQVENKDIRRMQKEMQG